MARFGLQNVNIVFSSSATFRSDIIQQIKSQIATSLWGRRKASFLALDQCERKRLRDEHLKAGVEESVIIGLLRCRARWARP
jgi:hypothetical protein